MPISQKPKHKMNLRLPEVKQRKPYSPIEMKLLDIVEKRGWYKRAGIGKGNACAIKTNLKNRKITIDRVHDTLHKLGHKIKTTIN